MLRDVPRKQHEISEVCAQFSLEEDVCGSLNVRWHTRLIVFATTSADGVVVVITCMAVYSSSSARVNQHLPQPTYCDSRTKM
jgi:hypothetical protein